MLITRIDFAGRVNIGENILDDDINICINNVELYVFKPMIDANLYEALKDLTTGSPDSQLKSFLNDFVKPFLVFGFAKDFSVLHGKNFTQFGIVTVSDDTSQALSNDARTEMVAVFERNYNICLTLLKNKLEEANYTFDNVVYLKGETITTIKPGSVIRAII